MEEMLFTFATEQQLIVNSISTNVLLMTVRKQSLLILSIAKLMAEWGNSMNHFTWH
jgi:hypothetical protein